MADAATATVRVEMSEDIQALVIENMGRLAVVTAHLGAVCTELMITVDVLVNISQESSQSERNRRMQKLNVKQHIADGFAALSRVHELLELPDDTDESNCGCTSED